MEEVGFLSNYLLYTKQRRALDQDPQLVAQYQTEIILLVQTHISWNECMGLANVIKEEIPLIDQLEGHFSDIVGPTYTVRLGLRMSLLLNQEVSHRKWVFRGKKGKSSKCLPVVSM